MTVCALTGEVVVATGAVEDAFDSVVTVSDAVMGGGLCTLPKWILKPLHVLNYNSQ